MNTKEMKKRLEKNGCRFRKRGKQGWVCFLDNEKVVTGSYLGELVWSAAKALGEEA